MKIHTLKCPECGAPLDGKLSKNISFCPYCGTPIFFDDETRRIEVSYKEERIIRDEARLKEAENRAEELRQRSKPWTENDSKAALVILLFFVCMMAAMLLFGYAANHLL